MAEQKQASQQPVFAVPGERDQVLTFLFSSCDAKNKVIEGLQKQAADLTAENKSLTETNKTLQAQLDALKAAPTSIPIPDQAPDPSPVG